MKPSKNKKIVAYGYIKKEDGVYTAICVNMGLFGQGNSSEEALDKVFQAIDSYINYIREKHPDEHEKYFNRPAPHNFVSEFRRGIANLKKLSDTKTCAPIWPNTFTPIRSFAEPISLAQA